MDANAPGFHNPESIFHRHSFKRFQELPDQLFEERQARIMRNPDNNNTVSLLRRKPQHIGKIQVKRYETTLLGSTDFIQPLIGATLQLLISDSQDIVTTRPKK